MKIGQPSIEIRKENSRLALAVLYTIRTGKKKDEAIAALKKLFKQLAGE